MKNVTTGAFFFLAAGIFTSVTILSAYQILFTISLCNVMYYTIKKKQFLIPSSAYWLLAFAAVALLSLVINYDILPKPGKNFGRLKYFIYGVGGIFVLRMWTIKVSDKVKRGIFYTFVLSIVVAGCYSLWSFFYSGEGRGGALTETMRYGYGTSMILLVLLGSILHKKDMPEWFNYKAAGLAFIIGFCGMYVTYTRGALLGFCCGLPFLLYFFKPKLGLILGSLALLGVLGIGGHYLFGSTHYESRFLQTKNNPSDVIRRSQWKAAIIATQEKPVLGWGLSNFHSQLKRIKTDYDLDAKDYDDAHSHNLFLEVASGTGLVGLFFFLGWLIFWALECFKAKGITRALVVPLGACFVVSSQFEVTLDANNASMIFTIYASSVFDLHK